MDSLKTQEGKLMKLLIIVFSVDLLSGLTERERTHI